MKIETEKQLLSYLDDYSIFCHFLGLELEIGKPVSSPFHEDNRPSFSIYIPDKPRNQFLKNGHTVMFKDFSLGLFGDVFTFVGYLTCGIESEADFRTIRKTGFEESKKLINGTFDNSKIVDISNVKKTRVVNHKPCDLQIVDRKMQAHDIEFWNTTLGITQETMDKYYCSPISAYIINGRYIYADKYAYSYEVSGHYQTYQPFNKQFKFFNNLESSMFFGYLQLPDEGEELIVDKSMKDVMFNDSVLNLPSVAPKGEGILIPHQAMLELRTRFKKIYLMLDNDKAGHKAAKKYTDKYNWLKEIYLPLDKDKTDCAKRLTPSVAKEHILGVINNPLNNFNFLK